MAAPVGIRALRWIVIAAVIAAAVGGLTISGPPQRERSRQLDERRQAHLEDLANRIDEYWNRKKALPERTEALVEAGDRFAQPLPRDPRNDTAYDYAVIDSTHYRLCAEFETDSKEVARLQRPAQPIEGSHFWDHPAGRACFTIKVRRYPVDRPVDARRD